MKNFLLTMLLAAGLVTAVRADVTPSCLFTDNAVIQQGMSVPVWGTAREGEKVTVEIEGHHASATTQGGRWMVHIKDLAPGGPFTMTIHGDNTLKVANVLVGDVWLCSGQSNMEFGLGGDSTAKDVLPKANDPMIHIFLVEKKGEFEPQDHLPKPKDVSLPPGSPSPGFTSDLHGRWLVCTPDNVAHDGGWAGHAGFSAVGYFFGHEIQNITHQPVGLLGSYYGGTPVESWISLDTLQTNPAFASYVATHAQAEAGAPALRAAFPAAKAKYDADLAVWQKTIGDPLAAAEEQWKKDATAAKAAGQPLPIQPKSGQPKPPLPSNGDANPHVPSVLYNAMIHPLIPYGIKGVIWYQGESNAAHPLDYAALFQTMIQSWRAEWGEGSFPFLYVQLASFGAPPLEPGKGNWPIIREAQLKTLALPETGMAVSIDIGDGKDIHPRDKADVGHRLALAGRHLAYGEKIVYSGPIYSSMKVEGRTIRLSFTHLGDGLKMAPPPWIPGGGVPPEPTALTGFAIAGVDQKWSWAKAVIDGKTVVVSSDDVPAPVAVRYGWADDPACDLYNVEGLPASPFRTDDWTLTPEPPRASAPPAPPALAPASRPPHA